IIDFVDGGATLSGDASGEPPGDPSAVSPVPPEEGGIPTMRASDVIATLGDGFRVDARIVLAERDDVLHIPTSALFRDGDGWSTFVIDGGRARRRTLQIGIRGEQRVEVLDGLQQGEVVILYPGDEVREGVR